VQFLINEKKIGEKQGDVVRFFFIFWDSKEKEKKQPVNLVFYCGFFCKKIKAITLIITHFQILF
jgi:hypothetical protein